MTKDLLLLANPWLAESEVNDYVDAVVAFSRVRAAIESHPSDYMLHRFATWLNDVVERYNIEIALGGGEI